MLTDVDILDVHRACCERMRNSGCLATPIPRAIEVRIGLERRRVVCSKFDVIEACARLNLALSDAP